MLAEEAREILRLASIGHPDTMVVAADVVESEDLGVWIRVVRDDGPHDFLLRWEYVLGIDMAAETGKIFGLSGKKDLG